MATLNGVHHLAIMTADVKSQIEFFSDVLGMKLKALYWMHNVEGYFHAFMELNPSCSVAFVYAPAVKDIPTEFGVSHAGNPVKPCAPTVKCSIPCVPASRSRSPVSRSALLA